MGHDKFQRNKWLGLVLLSCLCLFLWQPREVSAEQVESGLPVRSIKEVNDKWKQWMEQADQELPVFRETPSASSPYSPGSVHEAYLNQGLNVVNFYRFISGLEGDLVLDATLNKQAQHGAVLVAATGQLNHYPSQPADMPDSFYQLGYQSAGRSNLYYVYGEKGNQLVNSVFSYMDDSDLFNIDKLGHRRWILSPQLQKVGFGLAATHNAQLNQTEYYSAMQVFDSSRSEAADYRYSLYPNQGAFPIEAFGAQQAWSVHLNPQHFQEPRLSDVQVKLTRLADQKTWQFNQSMQPANFPRAGSPSQANDPAWQQQAYFNVDPEIYGGGYAVIFRPDDVKLLQDGDQYQVTITGLTKTDGTPAQISYQTEFFHIGRTQEAPREDASVISGFTDTGSHWANSAIQWAIQEQVANGYEDGTFKPDAQVTEAEFLAMLFKLYAQAEIVQAIDRDEGISQPNGGVWSDPYYRYAAALNLDVADRLQEVSLRNHAIKRVGVAQHIAGLGGKNYPEDNDAIRYLLAKGYSSGKTSATVKGYAGDEQLTRAEAIVFLKNLQEQGFQIQGRPSTPMVFAAQAQ